MNNTCSTPPADNHTPWTYEDARLPKGTPWKGNAWDGFMIRSKDGLIGVAYVEKHARLMTAAPDVRRASQELYDEINRFLMDVSTCEPTEELERAMDGLEAAWGRADGVDSQPS